MAGMRPSTNLKPFIYLLLLLALVSLTGCGPGQEQIAARTATAQTAVAALWTPTFTSTAIPTDTTTPTVTPTPVPTQTPTLPPTLTATSAPRASFTIKDVTFSFAAPPDWEKVESPNRVVLNGPTMDGVQLILGFSLDQYNIFGPPMDADETGIAMYSAHVQDTIAGMTENLVQVSEGFLKTAEGKPYFHWVMEHKSNGKELHQAFYIFGSGKWFLTVMYGRSKTGGAEYDELVDEAMKTLTFEK